MPRKWKVGGYASDSKRFEIVRLEKRTGIVSKGAQQVKVVEIATFAVEHDISFSRQLYIDGLLIERHRIHRSKATAKDLPLPEPFPLSRT